MRKEKGITLIALVITIIVMLILVGVTVSVALNGGLFKTAKDAAQGTDKARIEEEMQGAILGALDNNGNIELNKLKEELGKIKGIESIVGDSFPLTVKDKNGNEWTIDYNGEIEEIIVRNSTPLERYIFGENGRGRDLSEICDTGEDIWNFTDKTLDVKFISAGATSYTDYIVYIKYEGQTYKFYFSRKYDYETDNEIWKTKSNKGLELINIEQEGTKIGKYVTYDGKDWIVLYDDDTNKLQMICANALDKVNLGFNDLTIVESDVEDFDGEIGISDLEKAVYSYNHAIETLNNKCASLITPKDGVIINIRSVGSNPINSNDESKTLYNRGLGADNNYESDFDRMASLGITKASNEEWYWLASRYIDNRDDDISFHIRNVNEQGYFDCCNFRIWGLDYGGDYQSAAVRPVITLEPGTLDGLSGEGTSENPLILQ